MASNGHVYDFMLWHSNLRCGLWLSYFMHMQQEFANLSSTNIKSLIKYTLYICTFMQCSDFVSNEDTHNNIWYFCPHLSSHNRI